MYDKSSTAHFLLNPTVKNFENLPTFRKVRNEKFRDSVPEKYWLKLTWLTYGTNFMIINKWCMYDSWHPACSSVNFRCVLHATWPNDLFRAHNKKSWTKLELNRTYRPRQHCRSDHTDDLKLELNMTCYGMSFFNLQTVLKDISRTPTWPLGSAYWPNLYSP